MSGRLNAFVRTLLNRLGALAQMEIVSLLTMFCLIVLLTLDLKPLVRVGAIVVLVAAYGTAMGMLNRRG